MMGPIAYHAKLSKDQTVEERDGVKVVFAGGNVFHVLVGDAEKPIAARGVKAAWDRAEAERKKLDSKYQPLAYVKPTQPTSPVPAETEGARESESSDAPADNADGSQDEEPETKPDEEPDADDPPADGEPNGDDDGDASQPDADGAGEASEGEGATHGEPIDHVSLEGGDFPITLEDVEAVVAAIGDFQVRLPGFQGDPKLARLQERVRNTDGRCAPVFFVEGAEGEANQFLAGLETLGAAIHVGLKRVAVVIVPPETARESQGPIAAMFTAANAQVGSADDDMIYRAYQ